MSGRDQCSRIFLWQFRALAIIVAFYVAAKQTSETNGQGFPADPTCHSGRYGFGGRLDRSRYHASAAHQSWAIGIAFLEEELGIELCASVDETRL